jgi:hypothetical protein
VLPDLRIDGGDVSVHGVNAGQHPGQQEPVMIIERAQPKAGEPTATPAASPAASTCSIPFATNGIRVIASPPAQVRLTNPTTPADLEAG